jgi:hypothetical protein
MRQHHHNDELILEAHARVNGACYLPDNVAGDGKFAFGDGVIVLAQAAARVIEQV